MRVRICHSAMVTSCPAMVARGGYRRKHGMFPVGYFMLTIGRGFDEPGDERVEVGLGEAVPPEVAGRATVPLVQVVERGEHGLGRRALQDLDPVPSDAGRQTGQLFGEAR